MEPTVWFRIRHRDPFSDEAVAAFSAACAVYRAKMEAVLRHWDALAAIRDTPKPEVVFFGPEVSADRREMSLPIRIDRETLGSRALFHATASELYEYLPLPVKLKIKVGLTEPAFEGPGWRNDWWDPHRDNSIGPKDAFRRLGFKVKPDPEVPGRAQVVPGFRRKMQWVLRRVAERWGRRTRS